jgi:hypothetical protein
MASPVIRFASWSRVSTEDRQDPESSRAWQFARGRALIEPHGGVIVAGGPIDPNNEAHDLIMSVFGGVSKGERNRIKVRVRAAMATQAQMEGRYLGGRPPYGYRLIDGFVSETD